jgi:pyruvate formate lyase activating enzyme
VDPIEKKPFYHVYPGAETLTFGMLGCDYHCSYCQNWDISQALRDERSGRSPEKINPKQMIELGKHHRAKCVASSYNEPLITSEWAASVFKEARKEDLTCLYVSNGNATREVLEYIKPLTEGYKIDLKTMNNKHYRKLGGVLQNVLDTIQMVYDMGFWTEIVTLVVPGYNDSEEELREAARFIKSVSPDIPWHVTAFHKNYKMTDPDNTESSTLVRAAEIGYDEGLHFVYAGNDPGHVKSYENTYCPNCKTTLIERLGYLIRNYQITDEGCCPKCKTKIPGIWPKSKGEVNIRSNFFTRMPRSAF